MRVTLIRAMKFAPQIRELRVHLCPFDKSSSGVRDFINQDYTNIKNSNPELPILIREASGVQPRLWIRKEKGKETSVSLTNVGRDEILNHLKNVI